MAKFGLSQPLRRIEDPRLLKGGGRYTDDIAVKSGWPPMAWCCAARMPRRRSCRSIPPPALEVPGVLAVIHREGTEGRGKGWGRSPASSR